MTQIAQCKLCLAEKELMQSHVLPEFLYKPLYDSKHRFFQLSTDPEDPDLPRSKGWRERLLCADCEALINSRYEDYVSKVLNGQIKIIRRQTDDASVFEGLDYRRFKLFELSVLWRCHVASGPLFIQVNLGPIHGERLRQMLLGDDPGLPFEYGCMVFYSARLPKGAEELILPPEPIIHSGFGVYRAFLGGLFWCFVISDRPERFPLKRYFLTEEGTLILPRNDAPFKGFFEGVLKELADARRARGTA